MSGQQSTSQPSGLEELISALSDWFDTTQNDSRTWRYFYYIERSALILFSVLTTADVVNAIPHLTQAKGIFGALVALITAFDVWLKPETKYKAYDLANDEFDQLKVQLLTPGTPYNTDLVKAAARYEDICARLRAAL